MIKMQVIGNLGKDCLVNNVNGRNVINFTVAHTEKYKDSQGVSQEKTTWVECAWWTDRTAVAQYLTKGKQVFVEGQPEVRSFTRNDGSSGASLSLRVREVQLLGGRSEGAPQGGGAAYGNTYNSATPAATPATPATAPGDSGAQNADASDDLPF
ncbi:single-stranded DNA-binding protein [Niabella terrae]